MIAAITAFLARQSVKSVLLRSAELFLVHWKKILVLAILAVCFVKTYNAGFDSADNYWIAENSRQVKALNGKIERIEKASKAEAAALREQASDLQERLKNISTEFPTIVVHDGAGQVLKCDGKEVIPFLGPDFAESWNRLNREGELK